MSRYLVDQLAARANIRTMFGVEVTAVHGELSLEAIDVRDSTSAATTRLESGGLFIFIGADAQTGFRPRSRSTTTAMCSRAPTCARRGAGRSTATRISSRRASRASLPAAMRFGPVKRVAAAVGEGSMAIAFVHQYLRDAGASEADSRTQAAAVSTRRRVPAEAEDGSARHVADDAPVGGRQVERRGRRHAVPDRR